MGHEFDIALWREGELEEEMTYKAWHASAVVDWLLRYGKFFPKDKGESVMLEIVGESDMPDYVITIERKR